MMNWIYLKANIIEVLSAYCIRRLDPYLVHCIPGLDLRSAFDITYDAIMVYIKSWTEYQTQAEKLYEEQPTRVGYLWLEQAGSECIHDIDTLLRQVQSKRWCPDSQSHR
jgi:hypothetical protein